MRSCATGGRRSAGDGCACVDAVSKGLVVEVLAGYVGMALEESMLWTAFKEIIVHVNAVNRPRVDIDASGTRRGDKDVVGDNHRAVDPP